MAQTLTPKNHNIAIILSLLWGWLGIDRFYLEHYGVGISKIVVGILTLSFGGVIWWIVDFILILKKQVKNVEWKD